MANHGFQWLSKGIVTVPSCQRGESPWQAWPGEQPKLIDHVKHFTGGAHAKTLLGVFRQLLLMCTTQRYFFANQPSIMMQDCETFQQATFLTLLSEAGSVLSDVDNISCLNPTPDTAHCCKSYLSWRGIAGTRTRRSFWTFLCKTQGISRGSCLLCPSRPIPSCTENRSAISGSAMSGLCFPLKLQLNTGLQFSQRKPRKKHLPLGHQIGMRL